MSASKKLLSFVALGMLAAVGFYLLGVATLHALRSDYLRFSEDKDQRYYSEFAHACDAMLSQYPLGTNEFIQIPHADTSMPKIVRDLQPRRVTISSNWVHLSIGQGRGGFGITWTQDVLRTNVWILRTAAESLDKIEYEESR